MSPRDLDRKLLRKLSVLSLPVVIAAAACARSGATNEPKRAETPEPPPVAVKLVPADPIKVPRVLSLSGTLAGAEEAKVAAGAAGKVLATYVERGAVARKGSVLVKLDARTVAAVAQEAAAQVESLKVQQSQAQLDCDRNQKMFDKGAISKADFDRGQTACQTTKWSVQAAEARKTQSAEALRDTEIRAPFTGMVVERTVSAGEYVRPDSPVATLVDVDSLKLELTVPEADVARVRRGMTVEFRVASADGNGQVYRGQVRYVGPSVRQQTRDAVVEAVVENAGHDLRPGMFVTAKLALGEQALPAVPKSAVRADGPQRHVFVEVGGRLEDRLVQLGETGGDGQITVVDGLKAGDKVVAELSADVRDGARVK